MDYANFQDDPSGIDLEPCQAIITSVSRMHDVSFFCFHHARLAYRGLFLTLSCNDSA